MEISVKKALDMPTYLKVGICISIVVYLANLSSTALHNYGGGGALYRTSVSLYGLTAMCGVLYHLIGAQLARTNRNTLHVTACICIACIHIRLMWEAYTLERQFGTLYMTDFVGALLLITLLALGFFLTPDLVKVKK